MIGGILGGVTDAKPMLFDADYWQNALEVERELREQAPVHTANVRYGLPVWVITRYAEARAALADPRLAKDAEQLRERMLDKLSPHGVAEIPEMVGRDMLNADPPDHTRLRKLLARDFTARRVENLRPRVRELIDELLRDLPRDEPVDLIDRFAFPLPITVICELMGVPEADRGPLRGWTGALMDPQSLEQPRIASREMAEYFTGLIEDKRAAPADDLLSALTIASDDGDRLSAGELLSTAFLLIVAGHETTVNLIGNGARALLQEPQRWAALGAQPDQVPGAIEELLRFDGPLRTSTRRFTTEPVTIGDVTIPAGEIVLINITSANRDAARFERPDELELERGQAGHLTFGYGIHHCLGAPLARLEGTEAFAALTSRFPDARLAVPDDELRRGTSTLMNGFRELPLLLG